MQDCGSTCVASAPEERIHAPVAPALAAATGGRRQLAERCFTMEEWRFDPVAPDLVPHLRPGSVASHHPTLPTRTFTTHRHPERLRELPLVPMILRFSGDSRSRPRQERPALRRRGIPSSGDRVASSGQALRCAQDDVDSGEGFAQASHRFCSNRRRAQDPALPERFAAQASNVVVADDRHPCRVVGCFIIATYFPRCTIARSCGFLLHSVAVRCRPASCRVDPGAADSRC
jgi:hypothetical protein